MIKKELIYGLIVLLGFILAILSWLDNSRNIGYIYIVSSIGFLFIFIFLPICITPLIIKKKDRQKINLFSYRFIMYIIFSAAAFILGLMFMNLRKDYAAYMFILGLVVFIASVFALYFAVKRYRKTKIFF